MSDFRYPDQDVKDRQQDDPRERTTAVTGADERPEAKPPVRDDEEVYSPGYGVELVGSLRRRSVGVEAAFFQRHLRPGMSVLDCGCGPGTITLGLAGLVSPGIAIGIDREPKQLALTSSQSRALGIANVQFGVANAYSLPFPDGCFDAAFANALLQHLENPLAAVREMGRVLRRGGVIGIRDDDQGSLLLSPPNPGLDRVVAVIKAIMRHGGGDPEIGRRHRQLLRQAGFVGVEASASVEWDGDFESTSKRGDLGAAILSKWRPLPLRRVWQRNPRSEN